MYIVYTNTKVGVLLRCTWVTYLNTPWTMCFCKALQRYAVNENHNDESERSRARPSRLCSEETWAMIRTVPIYALKSTTFYVHACRRVGLPIYISAGFTFGWDKPWKTSHLAVHVSFKSLIFSRAVWIMWRLNILCTVKCMHEHEA
jgi:hypothetical protein